MPEEKTKDSKGMSDGAKYALIGTIITAIIGLVGTALTLYFNYLEKIEPQKLALRATQTAEARLTQSALSVILTNTYTPSPTPSPSPTSTPIVSPTPMLSSPTFTATPTTPVSGVKYCVDTSSLNVRAGPGLDYDVVGGLLQDVCIYFDGRLEDLENKWVRISSGQEGISHLGGMWVYGVFLHPQDFERLPVVTPPPPPPAPSPTPAG
jgi:hypothetical protein